MPFFCGFISAQRRVVGRIKVLWRYYNMWKKEGKRLFPGPDPIKEDVECSCCGTHFSSSYCPQCGRRYPQQQSTGKQFFSGSVSAIPFFNDEAKSTFVNLMLRPGYMIRDYISGKSNRYMSPFSSLLLFYTFFFLVFSIVAPDGITSPLVDILSDAKQQMEKSLELRDVENGDIEHQEIALKVVNSLIECMQMLYMDRYPEIVDTPVKAHIAALQGALRSNGIFMFLGDLILMTVALRLLCRKRFGLSWAASFSTTAYQLCQFCFFMFFLMIVTAGHDYTISASLIIVIFTYDFMQLFGLRLFSSLRLAVRLFLLKTVLSVSVVMALFLVLLIYMIVEYAPNL